MEVEKLVSRCRHFLTVLDTELLRLTIPEHGVVIAVLLLMSYFLLLSPRVLLVLFGAAGVCTLALAAYVAYRLSVRLEPKDDYE
jgi:hypothetical protein